MTPNWEIYPNLQYSWFYLFIFLSINLSIYTFIYILRLIYLYLFIPTINRLCMLREYKLFKKQSRPKTKLLGSGSGLFGSPGSGSGSLVHKRIKYCSLYYYFLLSGWFAGSGFFSGSGSGKNCTRSATLTPTHRTAAPPHQVMAYRPCNIDSWQRKIRLGLVSFGL